MRHAATRSTAALALMALCASAAVVSAASHDDGLNLESPDELAARLSHHDRRMHGQESPERFLERLPGARPDFYEHGREPATGPDEDPEVDEIKPGDGDDPNDGTADPSRTESPGSSRGLRDAYRTYRFRGTTSAERAMYFRFQELSAKAERGELSMDESLEMESLRRRGFGKFLKKTGKSIVKGVKAVGKFVGKAVKAVGKGALAVAGAALATSSKVANGNNKSMDEMLAQDIEDCVGCRFVWLGVELEVGNSQVEETVYDSFVKRCMEAEKAPIFFQTCQDMFDDVYGMIGDYMNGYTVNQVCEGAKMCR